jgi:hypothetical protein
MNLSATIEPRRLLPALLLQADRAYKDGDPETMILLLRDYMTVRIAGSPEPTGEELGTNANGDEVWSWLMTQIRTMEW